MYTASDFQITLARESECLAKQKQPCRHIQPADNTVAVYEVSLELFENNFESPTASFKHFYGSAQSTVFIEVPFVGSVAKWISLW